MEIDKAINKMLDKEIKAQIENITSCVSTKRKCSLTFAKKVILNALKQNEIIDEIYYATYIG